MLDTKTLLAALAYALLTGLLNLIFSKKTQINAWCEANPRLAAIGKLMRAVGFDPHGLWAFVTLFVTKKLPQIQLADSPAAKAEELKAELKRLADPDATSRIGPLAVLLFLAVAVHEQGCATPLPIQPDVCSKVSLATIIAGCDTRAKECTPGDTSCPVYLECKKAVATWRDCR
jgi:hypothetical protein